MLPRSAYTARPTARDENATTQTTMMSRCLRTGCMGISPGGPRRLAFQISAYFRQQSPAPAHGAGQEQAKHDQGDTVGGPYVDTVSRHGQHGSEAIEVHQ